MIDNHQYIDEKNGQVIGKWIVQSRKIASTVKLLLDFKKPTSCKLIIKFDVQKQGPTVDMIIRNGGCWIMSSEKGHTVAATQGEKRISVEINNYEFSEVWEYFYMENMTSHFRKKGYSKKLSRQMASSFIKEMRKVNFRI